MSGSGTPWCWLALSDFTSFAPEDPDSEGPAEADTSTPWVILVVDDDPGVQQATLMALMGERIHGRALEFLHAYSAADAERQLLARPDVAVVLLDVVMEAQDAGLQLIPRIRAMAAHAGTRIILRTGQPGQAPELVIRSHFAIDGYLTKGQQTRALLLEALARALDGGPDGRPGNGGH